VLAIECDFVDAKLFCGFIFGDIDVFRRIKTELENEFSAVDLESETFKFDFTDYYNQEMGTTLFKKFVSFTKLISCEDLPRIKLLTNEIEKRNSIKGARIINLDPGYLSDSNVIIATTKNHYHRVPLGKKIYAHMEYIFKKKKICTLEWTYPDFRTESYMVFFSQLRLLYRSNINEK
jgi:hypothetical protein